ncbi:MAG: hypothetical protein ACK40G_14635 [Cytophagaceae bacterium]
MQGKSFLYISIFLLATITRSYCCDDTLTNKKSIKRIYFPVLTFHLGASVLNTDGDIRLNSPNQRGTDLDYTKDLGFTGFAYMPRVNITVRFKRNQLSFLDFIGFNRIADTETRRPFRFGFKEFPEGTAISSRMHIYSANIAYRHTIISNRFGDVGILGGFTGSHIYTLITLQTDKSVGESAKIMYASPLIGFEAFFFPSQKIFIRCVAHYFNSPLTGFNFESLSFKPTIEYFFTENIGAGFRYHYFNTIVNDMYKERFDGRFAYHFHSWSLFVCYRVFR